MKNEEQIDEFGKNIDKAEKNVGEKGKSNTKNDARLCKVISRKTHG